MSFLYYIEIYNSNTTLVKVKFACGKSKGDIHYDSNTTLVKVKFGVPINDSSGRCNSNTTLVKVKSDIQASIDGDY